MNVGSRSHDPMRAWSTVQEELMTAWMVSQKRFWQDWFEAMKSVSWTLDPQRIARTGHALAQLQRSQIQALIDMQTQLARRWLTGPERTYGAVYVDSSRREEVVTADHPARDLGSLRVPPTVNANGAPPSHEEAMHVLSEALGGRVVEAEPAPEARPAGEWTAQGFPNSAGRNLLIQAVMSASRTDSDHAALAVDVILDTIAAALVEGEEVRLPGFGSFRVNRTQARAGRNPRTNQPMTIPAGHKVVFRAAADLRKSVSK